jgi:hypothetical protein
LSAYELIELFPRPGVRHEISGSLEIGREGDRLRVDDPQVSRRHARIDLSGDRVLIRDLGSQNGTYVNDERIGAERPLAVGDTIQVGHATLRLAVAEVAPTAAGSVPSQSIDTTQIRGEVPPPALGAAPAAAGAIAAAPIAPAGRAFTNAAPRRRRGSAARSQLGTAACFSIVAADAVALAVYFATR